MRVIAWIESSHSSTVIGRHVKFQDHTYRQSSMPVIKAVHLSQECWCVSIECHRGVTDCAHVLSLQTQGVTKR